MPVVDRQKERQIVERALERGMSQEQIKTAVLQFRSQGLNGQQPQAGGARQEAQVPGGALTRGAAKVGDFFGLGALGRGLGASVLGQLLPEVRQARQAQAGETQAVAGLSPEILRNVAQRGGRFQESGAIRDIEQGTTQDLTNRQVAGSALSTALLATGGAIPRPTSLLGRVGVGAGLGGATSGAISTARGAGTREALEDTAFGALIGGAIPVVAAGLKRVGQLAGKAISETLGIQTGAGAKPIEQAFRNPNNVALKESLRGRIRGDDILDDARGALYQMKDARGVAYRQQLGQIKDSQKILSLDPVKTSINEQLKNFNISRTKTGLNFSQSKIADLSEARRLEGLVKSVEGWKDTSPAGLDLLKQRLDDFYSPSSSVRSFVVSVRSQVRNQLTSNVKGYSQLTGDYRQATQLIKEIEKALSLGDKATKDTAIRKLAGVMRQNNEFRQTLVAALERFSPELLNKIAGSSLSSFAPRGLARFLSAGEAGALGLGAGLGPQAIPGLLGLAAASSPRIVGEAARVAGRVAPTIGRAGAAASPQVTAPLIGGLLGQNR